MVKCFGTGDLGKAISFDHPLFHTKCIPANSLYSVFRIVRPRTDLSSTAN
jgi:hypothetical protein